MLKFFYQFRMVKMRKEQVFRNVLFNLSFCILMICFPFILGAQSGFDLTGRVSFRTESTGYDEESQIKPDSISAEEYGKTTLIPGLSHRLNLAVFGRTKDMDLNLLSDLEYNDWNKFDLKRFSLNMIVSQHDIMIGDYFETLNETFIQSREIRGARYRLLLNNTFGQNSFIHINALGGITQKAVSEGEMLPDLYKQFESSGQYRRFLTAGEVKIGNSNHFDIALNYLWGEDQQSSIDTSINDPMANSVYGSYANLYFWERNIRFFGLYYYSLKDTLTAKNINDFSFNGGVDLQYKSFKFIALYQRLGYNYFSMGNPYLENDKEGFKGLLGYTIPDIISLSSDFEYYNDNLDNLSSLPTTLTRFLNISATSYIPGWPELTLRYGLRMDKSNTVYDGEENPVKTDRVTGKVEGGLSFGINETRFMISAIRLDMDDKSLLSSGAPLGTEQLIANFNLYTPAIQNLFFSGGCVYSTLKMTNNQKNYNTYLYGALRWDIVPRRIQLESNLTYINNDASGGDTQDLLNQYGHIIGRISLEYFFSNQLSIKIIAGTDTKKFSYSTEQALEIIADPTYGPTYFNSNESYNSLILGGEFNWIF